MPVVLNQSNLTTDGTFSIAAFTVNFKVAQSFVPSVSGSLDHVIVKLQKNGSPVGNLTMTLLADSGGTSPTGSVLSTSNALDVSTVSGTLTDYTFTFPNDYTMIANTKYWFVLTPTYAVDSANCIRISQNSSTDAYPAGNMNRFDSGGSVWENDQGTNDLYFKEYYTSIVTGGFISNLL